MASGELVVAHGSDALFFKQVFDVPEWMKPLIRGEGDVLAGRLGMVIEPAGPGRRRLRRGRTGRRCCSSRVMSPRLGVWPVDEPGYAAIVTSGVSGPASKPSCVAKAGRGCSWPGGRPARDHQHDRRSPHPRRSPDAGRAGAHRPPTRPGAVGFVTCGARRSTHTRNALARDR